MFRFRYDRVRRCHCDGVRITAMCFAYEIRIFAIFVTEIFFFYLIYGGQ